MSWWRIVRADLTRTPTRNALTAASLVLAFVLFGLLQPIRVMFSDGVALAGDARLIVSPKHSVADLLPVSHANRIARVDGVVDVGHMTWFGGTYQDPKNFFPQFAVTPASFLRINPEIQLEPRAAEAFTTNRRAAIVGEATAARFGWQAGDTITLIPNIWHNRDAAGWAFDLVGIFSSSNDAVIGNDGFYFGYDYFDEYRAFANGTVGTFVVQATDSSILLRTAKEIDATFANSSFETRTQSSAEYALSFVRQLGNVGAIATTILIAVLFTLLMVTGHAMARSVYERTAEIAVFRVLGFGKVPLTTVLLLEFLVLVMVSAGLGLAFAHMLGVALESAVPQVRQFGGIHVDGKTIAQGLLLALGIGLAISVLPVVRAIQRPIVPALRVEA